MGTMIATAPGGVEGILTEEAIIPPWFVPGSSVCVCVCVL